MYSNQKIQTLPERILAWLYQKEYIYLLGAISLPKTKRVKPLFSNKGLIWRGGKL